MSNDMLYEMVETLSRSNRNYDAVITVERNKNKLTAIKIINNNTFNKSTVDALCNVLIFNALKPENLSQGIGFGIGTSLNGRKCTLTRSKENEYVFSFR